MVYIAKLKLATIVINGLNYYKMGSAQSNQVKQPIKLIFLLNLGKLFLSLAQVSPSLFQHILRIFQTPFIAVSVQLGHGKVTYKVKGINKKA